jgi:UDP-2,3-diacylglucosamine hydrolase
LSAAADKHTLFISDLHLCAERPHTSELFFRFVREIAPKAEALYILGDLFEYWVGDDDVNDALAARVSQSLSTLAKRGVRVFLMQGNRDVLLGEAYAARCGARLIQDPTVIELCGTRTLLIHGDTLCTDDTGYQEFRRYIRNPQVQAQLLALPLAARHAKARELRMQSEISKSEKTLQIMDVNADAVVAAFRTHSVGRMIHGHTHRPNCHQHEAEGAKLERWVLADWDDSGEYLCCGAQTCLGTAAIGRVRVI